MRLPAGLNKRPESCLSDALRLLTLDQGLGGEKHDYTEEVGNAIKQLRKEGKIGILLVEQYLDFCLEVGDQFYIMDRGSIVAEGPMKNLNDEVVKKHLTV